MKKKYQNPETLIMTIDVEQALLETSNMDIDTGTTVPGEIDDDDKLVKRGRGGDVWDDDWSR